MWFYWIIVPLAWLVWHIAFRIRVIGRENLIHDRGFVIAPNHISAIDPVFVVIARFWGRPMVIMAKEELFVLDRPPAELGLAARGRGLCAPGKGRHHSGGKRCARGA